ncbi:hypothetical protein F5876DRAFT_83802 [Lentinula aff. lateritia]|uniref:Uncharacterized protein n=1 Tax=Lentinula aff. lateritia TaxID=2804960 RepID=A0ACC1THK8_9AGAR|nr:hypothetical protein F5876DRAFT_83802 [Lentinula aff. lateritia]
MAGLADDGISLALLLQARNLLDLALLAGCLFILVILVIPTVAPVVAVIGISGLGGTWVRRTVNKHLRPLTSAPCLPVPFFITQGISTSTLRWDMDASLGEGPWRLRVAAAAATVMKIHHSITFTSHHCQTFIDS